MLKLVSDAVPSVEDFMTRYKVRVHYKFMNSLYSYPVYDQMDHPAALHRLKVGVPATVEHSSEAGVETGKWVAETTQVRSGSSPLKPHPDCLQSFITFMDALKLRLRAKDQLHPILQELMTGYARFKGSKDWEGRSRLVGW